jgi:hypothetical protein
LSGRRITIGVSKALVKVNLGVNPVTVAVLEGSLEPVAVLELDLLGADVESHCFCVVWWGNLRCS